MRSAGHLILASTQAIAIFHFTAVCRAARQPSVKARRLSFTLFLARSFLFLASLFLFLLFQCPSSPFCSLLRICSSLACFAPLFSCDFCLHCPPLLWTRPVILCPLIQSLAAAPLSHSLSLSLSFRARVHTQSFAPAFIPGLWPLCFATVVSDCLFLLIVQDFKVIAGEKTTPPNSPHPNKPDPPVANSLRTRARPIAYIHQAWTGSDPTHKLANAYSVHRAPRRSPAAHSPPAYPEALPAQQQH